MRSEASGRRWRWLSAQTEEGIRMKKKAKKDEKKVPKKKK
jgi:hypothetical protein